MINKTYVTTDYYLKQHKGNMSEEDADMYIKKACMNIDVLTFNRIKAIGFENLKEWQQDTIREVVCEYADWLHDNQSLLETYLKSYSINGVSMTMDGAWNVYVQSGVAIRSDLFSYLQNTGLCCRLFGRIQ